MAIIDSYSESSYLADQVLADISHHQMAMNIPTLIIFDRPDVGLPSLEWQFHRQLIFHSYSENSYLAHQVLADLVPTSNGNCRFLLWELIFGRPSVGRSTPLFNADFTDSCFDHSSFLIWELIPVDSSHHQMTIKNSYPESSYLAHQVLADLSHHQMAIDTFLLWELIFGRPRCWQIYPPLNAAFHRFLLWQLIFHSYSENSYLADQRIGRSIPHVKWQL